MQDTLNVLPSLIIFEGVALCYLWELLPEFVESLPFLFNEQARLEMEKKEQEERLKDVYGRIMFELEVLQGRRNVRLVTRVENGVTKIYSH